MIIMSQQFVDRERELSFLEEKYREPGPQLIIVYGRRRIGKTELLLRFARDKPHIYYLCEKTRVDANLRKMAAKMAAYLGAESFAKIMFADWEELFAEFLRWKKGDERLVIILDEFPYLLELDKGLASLFQKIWDTHLSKRNDIFLVLTGSSIGIMETQVLGYKSPLYGRRTGQWKVTELPLHAIRAFTPNYTFEDVLKVYAALGGVPAYLSLLNPTLSLPQNIEKALLTKGSPLYEEAENLLRQELREPRNYKLILQAIAEGKRRVTEIASATGIDRAAVSRYLETLLLLEIVDYETPVLAPPKTKKRLYYIKDNYFNFWFRYIHPNRDLVESGRSRDLLHTVMADYPNYMGQIFERIATSFLACASPFRPRRIGRHWWKNPRGEAREIDVLAVGDNAYLLAEVKWSILSTRDIHRIHRALKEKAASLRLHGKIYYAVVAKKLPRVRVQGLLLYDLRDIEAATEADKYCASQ